MSILAGDKVGLGKRDKDAVAIQETVLGRDLAHGGWNVDRKR